MSFTLHAFRSSRALGIASNLSGPVPVSPPYGFWQSEVVYSCSLPPGLLPPMAPTSLDLNQRHKSSEEYFNLHHSVILLLQGEFNFKISPLSVDEAALFSFPGVSSDCSISAACCSLQRISSTFLHSPGHHRGGLHGVSLGCREPAELGRAPPMETSAALPHQHIEEDGGTPHLIWEAYGGRPQLGLRQLHEGPSTVSPAPQPVPSPLSCPCSASVPL